MSAALTDLWSHLSARTRAWMAFHIIFVITGGLWLDIHLGWTGQHLATIWACGRTGLVDVAGPHHGAQVLLLATLLSGFGEVFLSLVWGVYDYQFHNVPLFVPPGHALLMTLGILGARELGGHAKNVVVVVTGLAGCWAAYVGFTDQDRFGVALFGCMPAGSGWESRDRSTRRCLCWRSSWNSMAPCSATGCGRRLRRG